MEGSGGNWDASDPLDAVGRGKVEYASRAVDSMGLSLSGVGRCTMFDNALRTWRDATGMEGKESTRMALRKSILQSGGVVAIGFVRIVPVCCWTLDR